MPESPDNLKTDGRALSFGATVAEELLEIQRLREARKQDGPLPPSDLATLAKRDAHSGPCATNAVFAAKESQKVFDAASGMDLVGLSFSGGGIRSATFNLGILQGLADLGLLRKFDYLSTVSGGGYIGSWLQAWILRAGRTEKIVTDPRTGEDSTVLTPQVRPGIDFVEQELKPRRVSRLGESMGAAPEKEHIHTEPPPVRFLREYSNYLTPRLGILGADTWAMISILLRNLLLNQLVLTLFLFSLLLLPYIAGYLTKAALYQRCADLEYLAPVVAFVLLLLSLSFGAMNLEGLLDCKKKHERNDSWFPQSQGWILISIVVPIFLSAWIVTGWLWNHADRWNNTQHIGRWVLGGIVGLAVPWIVSCFSAPKQTHGKESDFELRHRRLIWGVSAVAMGALAGLLMYVVFHEVFAPVSHWPGHLWHELGMGVPLTLMVFLIAATIQLGLMGRTFFDPYREWWGRLAGLIFILTIVWAAGFALAILSPLGLMQLRAWIAAAGLGWVGTTATGVLGAKDSKTGDLESNSWKDMALSVTPYVFIAGLVSLLSLALELILARLNSASLSTLYPSAWGDFLAKSAPVEKVVNWVLQIGGHVAPATLTLNGTAVQAPSVPPSEPLYIAAHWHILEVVTNSHLFPYCAIAFVACLLMAWRVDLNEFSMNLFYRNRLVRCYLGATHDDRVPSPFTGFDCGDDLFLKDLRSEKYYSGPFPIFNGTLNLVSTRDLAWQERKAESFPMTPLRCGYDTWFERVNLSRDFPTGDEGEAARRDDREASKDLDEFAYRRTERYAYNDGGFHVGTAVGISGAALSPNMGFHSVPSLAMLMTFFNVRLGFWAGNPRNEKMWQRPGPRMGLWRLLGELFGLTDDNARYVYLSDGGHFENLGVYELVKRRTKFIIACDAGGDPNYALDDLGNAIRKCREDIGVEIELDTAPVVLSEEKEGGGANSKKRTKCHCTVGKIHYEDVDPEGAPGIFVYVKASLTGDEPADVLNYQTCHSDFPHQTTADQWFTESQFESYRRLGQHIAGTMFENIDVAKIMEEGKTSEIFNALERKWGPKQSPETERGEIHPVEVVTQSDVKPAAKPEAKQEATVADATATARGAETTKTPEQIAAEQDARARLAELAKKAPRLSPNPKPKPRTK
jgi:hypothetical protein